MCKRTMVWGVREMVQMPHPTNLGKTENVEITTSLHADKRDAEVRAGIHGGKVARVAAYR